MNIKHCTTGNLFMMSGIAVNWLRKKKSVFALFTTEVEYIALSSATQQAMYVYG